MSLDEVYFKKFDKERICIDKVFFIIYDKKYAQTDHPFDTIMRDRFIQSVKRSRIGKGRFEQVLRKENEYSSWELQMRGARLMYFHVNVIHFLQYMHDIKPQNVIYDDNYMPIDSTLTIIDYVAALRKFIDDAKELYREEVYRHWGYTTVNVQFKISQIELPYEVYPASVDDVAQRLYAKGVAFRKYNTQSGTIYLDMNQYADKDAMDSQYHPDLNKFDNEHKVKRKYDNVSKFDNCDVELHPSIVYMNKLNSGRNENKIQIKIYQKTFGLVRIEITAFSADAKSIFLHNYSDETICKILIQYVHFNLMQHDIEVDRYDRCLDDVVQFLAKAFKEKEDTIYSLKECDMFEACKANRLLRERLVRKGVLNKKFDSDGIQQRGVYLVNPVIKDLLNLYKEKGTEHFTKGSLYPRL